MKRRIEFRLTMPGRASWNGNWSGSKKNFSVVRSLSTAKADAVLSKKSYGHSWSDGWYASVEVREMLTSERAKKSDGFSGYDWMIDNIVDHGSTYYMDTP